MKLKLYLVFLTLLSGIIFGSVYYQTAKLNLKAVTSQKVFTTEELKKYDGTDSKLPIYIALDGNVYDVTKGKEFYIPGAPYHSLAGKDSSVELHIAGGDIIKRKYPIVGKLSVINK